MELTGLQNPMVKAAAELKQKKYRQQQGLFLAEGLRTVEEAVRYGAVQSIFYTAIEDDRTRAVLEEAAAKQIKLVCVSDKVLKKIADTETPQGIIAVCEMRSKRLDEFLASGKMLLVLDRVTDPGNIGTMLRTADAAGVGGLLLLQGCADIYAPKTVRASMGSLFHLPVLSGLSEELLVQAARKAGYELLVTAWTVRIICTRLICRDVWLSLWAMSQRRESCFAGGSRQARLYPYARTCGIAERGYGCRYSYV